MRFLSTVLALLITLSSGRDGCRGLSLAWDPNPVSDNVVTYEITVAEVFGLQSSTYTTSATTLAITGLQVGRPYLVTARAKSAAGLWSESSEALAVTPQIRRVFEYSNDLKTWVEIKTDTGTEPQGFMRIRILPP